MQYLDDRDVAAQIGAREPAFWGSYRSDDLSATAAWRAAPYRAFGAAQRRPPPVVTAPLGSLGVEMLDTAPRASKSSGQGPRAVGLFAHWRVRIRSVMAR